MKNIRIALCVLILPFCAFGQNPTEKERNLITFLNDSGYCDSSTTLEKLKYYYSDKQFISSYSMNRLIRQDLSKITLDKDGMPVIGNYASIKYSDDNSKITLNTSIYNPFRRNNLETKPILDILSINIKAGVSDGIASLFANKNASSGAGITAKWSFISRKTNYENYNRFQCESIDEYRRVLRQNFLNAKAMHELTFETENDVFNAENNLLTEQLKVCRDKKDTANVVFRAMKLKQLALQKKFNETVMARTRFDVDAQVDSTYKQLLEIETKNIKWDKYQVKWFDLDVGASGEKYYLFNKSNAISNQVEKQPFTFLTVGLSWNSFRSSGKGFFKNGLFLKYGYSISRTNSLVGAETKEVSNTITIDTPGFQRKVNDKRNVYDQPFLKSFTHNLNIQLTRYLDNNKSTGISMYSTLGLEFDRFRSPLKFTKDPVWMVGTGYTLAFLDKEKAKAFVNIEVFLHFTDILNSAEDESKFYNRHSLGIKLGVPFNSIFLNKE